MPVATNDYADLMSIVFSLLILLCIFAVPIGIVVFLLLMRKRSRPIRNGIAGTARVISTSYASGGAVSENCTMNLVVQAPTVQPTAVRWFGMVRLSRWPSIGDDLPVSIDPRNTQKVSVLWNQVPSTRDRAAAEAQRVAQSMRDRASGGDGFGQR
ncbi:hypothetical protein [Subtercola endophyticus]|uniref:hypothetical protein n=1 Tax=Subtercola endophyticus TaxID=2895559 RepID=UPI001E284052|nr:hypothetical protein [Subtercola endophyticus]UFS60272.1 hypothetical protein LQ955_05850 [Subtercola endophyticus]